MPKPGHVQQDMFARWHPREDMRARVHQDTRACLCQDACNFFRLCETLSTKHDIRCTGMNKISLEIYPKLE